MLAAQPAAAADATAEAARYPIKAVRMVIGFSPGGAVDVQGRLIAQGLAELLGQQVLVDNRPGQDGIIAGALVAKAPPDGYAFAYVSAGHAMNSVLHAKTIPYHPIKDFAPISLTASGPLTLVVNPALPVKDLKGLIELARKRPGQLNFASSGSGGTMHLAGELLKTVAKVDIVHVPYKGGGPAITDVLGGQVELTFVGAPASMPHIRSGRLRVLAVTTPKRATALPDVPTVAEAGYPGYEVSAWYGALAPAGTPVAIVARLTTELAKAVAAPKTRERLLALGIEPIGSTPEQFTSHLQNEIARWTPIIQNAGIKTD
ncbi:MAG: tripartite tricarboxylate transporter substrate binding protein [Burkholderiales bacterium]|nr:tripartite tricarboxylate transporter substrate binding protein [Burkholderiales bacterium]